MFLSCLHYTIGAGELHMKRYWKEIILLVLVFSNILVWSVLHQNKLTDTLTVSFLDIGQGDAIFIDSPQHGRVLIDGGKNRKVLSELTKVLPFGDKRIDIVIATHPDLDHIRGLPEVVDRYDVSIFLESGVPSNNSTYEELLKMVSDKNISKLLARRGMIINFGDGAKLYILYPLPNTDLKNFDPNDASIVAKLVYGKESFLLTGDAEIKTENALVHIDGSKLKSDVLKAGHHGSKTSSSLPFVEQVLPVTTIISAGLNNSYGHPHQEVLDRFNEIGSTILNTALVGSITFKTDGEDLRLK